LTFAAKSPLLPQQGVRTIMWPPLQKLSSRGSVVLHMLKREFLHFTAEINIYTSPRFAFLPRIGPAISLILRVQTS